MFAWPLQWPVSMEANCPVSFHVLLRFATPGSHNWEKVNLKILGYCFGQCFFRSGFFQAVELCSKLVSFRDDYMYLKLFSLMTITLITPIQYRLNAGEITSLSLDVLPMTICHDYYIFSHSPKRIIHYVIELRSQKEVYISYDIKKLTIQNLS